MQPNFGANGQPTCEQTMLPSASTQKGAEVPAHSLSGVLLAQACAGCSGSTTEFDQLAGLRGPVAELGERRPLNKQLYNGRQVGAHGSSQA